MASKLTVNEAIRKFESYIGKPRKTLPWLKNRLGMSDCAAGYSYIVGYKDVISCRVIKEICVKNGTWKTKGIPKKGDAIIFDWSGKKTITDHVGMVISTKRTLKGFTVTYVSANSTQPSPGLVSINRNLDSKWVAGWGLLHAYKPEPIVPPVIPTPTAEDSALHN